MVMLNNIKLVWNNKTNGFILLGILSLFCNLSLKLPINLIPLILSQCSSSKFDFGIVDFTIGEE